jgi:carbon-monoxide dehydrogenase iron sulfur subunit
MAENSERRLSELQEQLRQGAISRRHFLRYATLLGLSAAAAEALAACAPAAAPTSPPPTCPPAPTCPPQEPCPTAEPCPEPTPCPEVEKTGWGMQNYDFPRSGYIEPVEQLCVGCGMCELACAMQHFGVMNKDFARVRVTKYMLPLPKAIQSTCVQCAAEERECEKACPLNPKAIYFDDETGHMVVNKDTCAGAACLACVEACPAESVHFNPDATDVVFVCDLCDIDNTGNIQPQCVEVCNYGALVIGSKTPRDCWRVHSDEKAELMARRMYPLSKTEMATEWRMSNV